MICSCLYIYAVAAKCEEIKALNQVPEASGIIEVDEAKFDEDDGNVIDTNDTDKNKFYLLFVVHFNPSKYIHCNYCFVINYR